jgi:hypothetical protein
LIENSSVVFVSESELIGQQLYSVQQHNGRWILVAKVNTKPVCAIGPHYLGTNTTGIGYEDGTVEFRDVKTLQPLSFWDSMFPGMLHEVNEPLPTGMIEDLDSIFDSSKGVASVNSNDIPIILRQSPNQTHLMRFAICPDNANRCIVRLEVMPKPSIVDKAQERLFSRLSELIIMAHRNGNDLEDLAWLLRDLLSQSPTQLELMSKMLIHTYKTISGRNSLSECLFDNSNCGYVVGEVVVYQYFLLNSVNPNSYLCENVFFVLQFGLIKDIISRAVLNPHESIATMESALYNYASAEPFLKFHIGSTHHMAAFIMWVLDFSGYLLRYLYLYLNHRPVGILRIT